VYVSAASPLAARTLSPWSCSLALAMTTLFMASSCGCERIFQAMQFTFAMCSDLRLPPDQAVKTDVAYSAGFLLGRKGFKAAYNPIGKQVPLRQCSKLCASRKRQVRY